MAQNQGDPFEQVLDLSGAILAELRRTNTERFGLRYALQRIVDLKAGGEAEVIARQALADFAIVEQQSVSQIGHPLLVADKLFD